MVTRIARKTYQKVIGNPTARKAIALAILLKDHNGTSVYKGFSYRELSRISGLSPNTCKARIATLVQLHLAEICQFKGQAYLKLAQLRRGRVEIRTKNMNGKNIIRYWYPKTADVKLDSISRKSIKDIEKGLMAIEIVEITIRKEFVKHAIDLAHNPSPYESTRRIRRAKKVCDVRGYGESFADNGISYRYLQRRLGCSSNTISKVVEYGESHKLFATIRKNWELIQRIGKNAAKFALPFFQNESDRTLFATRDSIWYRPALSFVLLERQTI